MKIVLGVTGSIAAVESVKLVRELVREGAEVICVMTEWAQKIIHPHSLEFASGRKPITDITGQVEHVGFCGNVPDKADLYLIAPATANTISKIAHGIDDTPVTTFATTCLGSGMPMMVVPAMHQSMYEQPVIVDNINKLKNLGIKFIGPYLKEGTAKVAPRDQIVDEVVRELSEALKGRNIIIVTGRTQEPMDSMRIITNKASGKSGVELAKRAHRKGADVELWHGNVSVEVPDWIPQVEFNTFEDLLVLADEVSGTVIVPAALSDFGVREVNKSKLPSDEPIIIELQPLPKFIDTIRDRADFLVAYKAADSREEAVEKAKIMVEENRADVVIANSLKDVGNDETRAYITGTGKWFQGRKRDIADRVLSVVERRL
ncbi:MAG: bifunctional phosphopantothenoylcysteine decarboxylase/phosphopantothenate--cysteine ligase CoaBC [Thermoplasmata archaeon]